MTPLDFFPRLTPENHRITSPATNEYNCIAWACNDTEHWWQPGVFWPVALSHEDYGIGALEQVFLAIGFLECADGALEAGYEKVALCGNGALYTHAARQLKNGKWTSKLGKFMDIEHSTPEDLTGDCYGEVMQYMKRKTSE